MKQIILGIVIVVLTYGFAVTPVLHDGLFQVYDNVQVTRIQAMYSEIKSGQLIVRYLSEFGHGGGYMLFKYYSPLLYYLGAFWMSFGLSAIKAVKLIYLIMLALGAIGMWKLVRAIGGRANSAWIATTSILSAPYVYHDFFHRGSMTESGAMMLLPLLLWAFVRLGQSVSRAKIGIAAILFASVILTHALTGVMALCLLCGYPLFIKLGRKEIAGYVMAIVLGIALAGFNLVPSLSDKVDIQYENNSLLQRGYLDHPVALLDQGFNQGVDGQKSAYLGITLGVSYLALILIYLTSRAFRAKYGKIALYLIVVSSLGLWIMSPSSAWVWEKVIYLRYFQFPFRWLCVVSVTLALSLGIIADYYEQVKWHIFLIICLILVPLIFSTKYYQPLGYQYGIVYTVDDPCMTSTWADEYLPKWVDECLTRKPEEIVVPEGEGEIHSATQSENGRRITFESSKATGAIVSKYYLREWKAYDQNQVELKIGPSSPHGLIRVELNPQSQQVTLRLTKSRASQIGDYLSLISLVIVMGLVMIRPGAEKS